MWEEDHHNTIVPCKNHRCSLMSRTVCSLEHVELTFARWRSMDKPPNLGKNCFAALTQVFLSCHVRQGPALKHLCKLQVIRSQRIFLLWQNSSEAEGEQELLGPKSVHPVEREQPNTKLFTVTLHLCCLFSPHRSHCFLSRSLLPFL